MLALALIALPALGGAFLTVAPAFTPGVWQGLMGWPGLLPSVRLTLVTGLISTALAYLITLGILASLWHSWIFTALRRGLSPILALPHAAAALGIAVLIAPSGWIARALSPWATGWTTPPDLLILNDPWGISLIIGLVAKEVPFLMLMALADLPRIGIGARMAVAASLGHGRVFGFWAVVHPALGPRLTLPVLAVLAYGLTNVDMAMILGPSLPPTLAVQVTDWMTHPSGATRDLAGAGAGLLILLTAAAFGFWLGLGWAMGHLRNRLTRQGHRFRAIDLPTQALTGAAALGILGLLTMGLAVLALWSVAGPWSFPAALPQTFSLRPWTQALPGIAPLITTSMALGLCAAFVSLVLVIALLQSTPRPSPATQALIYLPLILPQVTLLPGLSAGLIATGLPPGLLPVFLAHLIFVLPYVYLSLSGPWTGRDPRLEVIGQSLGAGPARRMARITLPMLTAPILTALAVGFAVSVAQYLPTILMGGGRVETLTTEAIALSSGGNRRLTAALALTQAALPALAFAMALAIPRLVFHDRAGMRTSTKGAAA
jgi:putative thiamine transport system permease protein